ncbi:hypothetical protein ALIPUT_01775 [Alistipes putredinis DSM 17216]|uniref:Uncharacterized protein n=1 Tax=Alistipes putredinis DSM 17216 TaxID=445970 RepID=B0MX39_9BACT|nr:hypothetical protein ALIPUT_01775 [Alistipes putredinis DSM 17216]
MSGLKKPTATTAPQNEKCSSVGRHRFPAYDNEPKLCLKT